MVVVASSESTAASSAGATGTTGSLLTALSALFLDLLKAVILDFLLFRGTMVRLSSEGSLLLLTMSDAFTFLSGGLGLMDNDCVDKLLLEVTVSLVGLGVVFVLFRKKPLERAGELRSLLGRLGLFGLGLLGLGVSKLIELVLGASAFGRGGHLADGAADLGLGLNWLGLRSTETELGELSLVANVLRFLELGGRPLKTMPSF